MAHRYTTSAMLDYLRGWVATHGSTPTKRDWEYDRPAGAPHEFTYRLRFGSWSAAIAQAGLAPNRAGRRSSSDRLAAVIEASS